MNGFQFAVSAWFTGALSLLLTDNHGWHVTVREVLAWGTGAVIAVSAVAFVAMMACCLYADYRVIRSESAQ
jgi:hypothetical protein